MLFVVIQIDVTNSRGIDLAKEFVIDFEGLGAFDENA